MTYGLEQALKQRSRAPRAQCQAPIRENQRKTHMRRHLSVFVVGKYSRSTNNPRQYRSIVWHICSIFANPSGASSPELRDGRCTACDKPVPPGAPNWAAHCETPGHAAWTDPGLRGDRRACELHCELCVLTISNGKNNWTNHVRTKRHQQALACAPQAPA